MADDVWAWCEKSGQLGRTVTEKVKWTNFRQATLSRSLSSVVAVREVLRAFSLDFVRSVLPPPKGIRLVGVTLSNFRGRHPDYAPQGDLMRVADAAA